LFFALTQALPADYIRVFFLNHLYVTVEFPVVKGEVVHLASAKTICVDLNTDLTTVTAA
jgi:hypothetical protein